MRTCDTPDPMLAAIRALLEAPDMGHAVGQRLTGACREARDQAKVIDLLARRAARDARGLISPETGRGPSSPPARNTGH